MKILKPADISPEVWRFLVERWAEHMKPLGYKFVEAGLVGKRFTDKAPDMPAGRLNYLITEEGFWKFDFEAKEDTGETIISYVDFESGYRAAADINYDYGEAVQEGKFAIDGSFEDAMKMGNMMSDIVRAFKKAIEDTENKFTLELPKY